MARLHFFVIRDTVTGSTTYGTVADGFTARHYSSYHQHQAKQAHEDQQPQIAIHLEVKAGVIFVQQ